MNCERIVFRKARKNHFCCECGKTIQIGEQYEYSSGIWEGQPESHKTCGYCADLRTLACRLAKKLNYPDECYPHYSLLSDFRSYFKQDCGVTIEEFR